MFKFLISAGALHLRYCKVLAAWKYLLIPSFFLFLLTKTFFLFILKESFTLNMAILWLRTKTNYVTYFHVGQLDISVTFFDNSTAVVSAYQEMIRCISFKSSGCWWEVNYWRLLLRSLLMLSIEISTKLYFW